ncbi:MAG: aminotransferase class I/II-fold pyridoxal phosphate-dependent enzyme, partial [Planctomycetes bacterium]|nr:aminotransferase class I/II-fold pyridoxal phosphate-dependent enzyme [Planctomycetota bacterium]
MTVESPSSRQKVNIAPDCGAEAAQRGLSQMANAMSGSSILKIANEIRELLGRGVDVANLTVGDFSPSEFPIPTRLTQELLSAVGEGDTNYPPSAGVWDLRDAVRNYIRRTQGLDYPLEGVAIVSGGRPTLYSTFRLLTDPGDKVVFPVP